METTYATSTYLWSSFQDYESAAQAVGAFMDHGVPSDDIQLFTKNIPLAYKDVDSETTANKATHGITVTTGADAAVGAEKGLVAGLGVGILAGLAALAIPGFGLVIGGGALATAIAGAAGVTAAGALAGAIAGYLRDQGVDEELISTMTSRIEAGDVIVSARLTGSRLSLGEARALTAKYGGSEVAASDATATAAVVQTPQANVY